MKGIQTTVILAGGLLVAMVGCSATVQDAEKLLAECNDQLFQEGGAAPGAAFSEATLELCEKALAASPGEKELMLSLGTAYLRTGRDDRAAELIQAAVDLEYLNAYAALAFLYMTGTGVPTDYRKARQVARHAANLGDSSAQNILGVMCAAGLGAPADKQEAARWFRLAAEQGNRAAAEHLRRLENKP
ncbi:tetratricopeptide repeat protein [Pelagibius marinus]|uniref:tetratricopeptide repeat protein n=1 Tax=Pelagibius marinus TaxID=2762760 RepID=UPI0018729B2C|nr:tetratricopeptide repeat protein [Pelagibius marinus]